MRPEQQANQTDGQRAALRILGKGAIDYDRIVSTSTGGLDDLWKRWMIDRMDSAENILDLACGTGILTFLVLDKFPNCRLHSVDLQRSYLDVARARAEKRGVADRVTFVHSSAEDVELSASSFDWVLTSYLPKYAVLPRLSDHLWRWAAPGARLILHDFTYPAKGFVQKQMEDRLKTLDEQVQQTNPRWVGSFSELLRVIKESDWEEELPRELKRVGFSHIRVHSLSYGCAAAVTARKPD